MEICMTTKEFCTILATMKSIELTERKKAQLHGAEVFETEQMILAMQIATLDLLGKDPKTVISG